MHFLNFFWDIVWSNLWINIPQITWKVLPRLWSSMWEWHWKLVSVLMPHSTSKGCNFFFFFLLLLVYEKQLLQTAATCMIKERQIAEWKEYSQGPCQDELTTKWLSGTALLFSHKKMKQKNMELTRKTSSIKNKSWIWQALANNSVHYL